MPVRTNRQVPDDMGVPAGSAPLAADVNGTGSTANATPTLDIDRRPWWITRWGRLVLQLIPGIVFLFGWFVVQRMLDSSLVPTVSSTARALVESLFLPEIWKAFAASNRTLLVGFSASALIGIPLGLLMGRLRTAERLFDVWLDLLIITPMAAVIPLVIMSLGLGLVAQSFVIICFAMPMVAINTRAGVREVPSDLIDMSKCFGANERQIWHRVILPSASPAIWAGLRIGLGRSILGMVIVELLMTAVGIGQLLQIYRSQFAPDKLYALITLIIIESLVLISLCKMIESRLTPWSTDRRAND